MDHGERAGAVAEMENLAVRFLFKFSIALVCLTLALPVAAHGQERVRADFPIFEQAIHERVIGRVLNFPKEIGSPHWTISATG